jgi:hypothetical protein
MNGRAIGVDPGLRGALALVERRELIEVADIPVLAHQVDAWSLSRLLIEWGKVDMVAIEKVHAMPRQGVVSTFKFGMTLGTILGIVATLDRSYILVSPRTWQHHHHLDGDKAAHIRKATELWPSKRHLFEHHDGRADAALIAAAEPWR